MLRDPRSSAFASLLVLAGVLSSARSALADPTKAECASAYEKSQEQRANGRLIQAQEQLSVCASEACPAFVRTDCGEWLTEVSHEIPTVSFSVKNRKGEDEKAVKVTVDGDPLVTEIGDESVQVDPGTHKFEFTIEGAPPLVKEIEIRKGEKDRVINASFAPAKEEAKVEDPYGHGTPEPEPKVDEGASSGPGPLRPYAYVAGGVGAAGILGFVVFGAMGKSKQSDLDSSCGQTHSCAQSDVDSIKTKYLLADVSLGVGIAGLGAGVALFFLSQPKSEHAAEPEESAHFDVAPRQDGAVATFSGRF
ncbi:MAG TPA: hypothetical protein VHE30_10290 [Polyangiaceae bacterium]|nr:hypothetical protein [Polyangiaceae bacterium]